MSAAAYPRISVNQLCLPETSFAEDVRIASALGYTGISIDVAKLGDGPDDEAIELFRASGLRAGVSCNSIWSVLPIPNFPDPADPEERIDSICAGIRRLAPFAPDSVFVVLGQPGDLDLSAAWRVLEDGLRRIRDVAGENGMTLSVETMTREGGRLIDQPMVSTIEQTLDVFTRLGMDDAKVVADIWHLWDSPHFLETLRSHATRISALQMCDYHQPKAWRDRLMPGAGQGRVREALGALEAGGFSGWLDLEVFSDELWQQAPERFMAQGLAAINDCWENRA